MLATSDRAVVPDALPRQVGGGESWVVVLETTRTRASSVVYATVRFDPGADGQSRNISRSHTGSTEMSWQR